MNIEDLRQIAEQATPREQGPWRWLSIGTLVVDKGRRDIVLCHAETCDKHGLLTPLTSDTSVGRYIGALDPQTVLLMLDALEAVDKAMEDCTWKHFRLAKDARKALTKHLEGK